MSSVQPVERDGRSVRMREERRRTILKAAKESFAERGYHHASINDIIGRAGIARGTFYLYFEGKHAVFESILNEALDALRSRIKSIDVDVGAPAPQIQLRGSLIRVMEYVVHDPHFAKLLLSEGADAEAEVQLSTFYSLVTDLITSSLEQGINMGLVRPCAPRLIASALLGTVRGIIGHLNTVSETPDVEAVVDELIAFVLRGVVVSGRW